MMTAPEATEKLGQRIMMKYLENEYINQLIFTNDCQHSMVTVASKKNLSVKINFLDARLVKRGSL